MSEKTYTPRTFVDFISEFSAGMNSGVAPQILPKNQISFGLNCSLRGGFIHQRPPLNKQTLNFNGDNTLRALVIFGFFQGAGYYRPDYGTESLIAQISGHLIKFTETGGSWLVEDISIAGDLNSPTVPQVWMWQAEKWMIVQDGSGALPIFFDGTTSRRSYGPTKLLGVTAANFTPPTIGTTVILTLTEPYNGPYDVSVILNGEFYQPTRNAGGYEVILTNITGQVGESIPSGTPILINPALIAYCPVGGTSTGGVGYGQFQSLKVSTTANFPPARSGYPVFDPASNVIVSNVTAAGYDYQSPGYNNSDAIFSIVKINNDGTVWLQFSTPIKGVAHIGINALIRLPNSTAPNFIIGNTAGAFTVPVVGQSANVLLTQPYSGQDGQVVLIGSEAFSIANPPNAISTTSLIVINLTDTKTTPAVAPQNIMSVPELPAGRMGAYGMGCNAMSLTDGIGYVISDVVGAGSGTPANNYRDSVLKMTQNTFLAGGGSFRLPGTGDLISAMVFPPTMDTSLGQGPLQVGTPFSFFTNVVPGTDPTNWPNLTFAIQTESLKDNGPLGHNSTTVVNSDTFFRSNIGIGSLVLARRDFNQWGNKPVSDEVGIILDDDTQSLLTYGSAMSFDNRFQCTVSPRITSLGVIHQGGVVLNFDLISTMREVLPPSWEGLWTGLNNFQFIFGRVNGERRAFSFSFNYNSGEIELYEILKEKTAMVADNDATPIFWAFETPCLFNKDVKAVNELVQLRDGECYLSDIVGNVHVKILYRPDYYACWTKWTEFDVCQASDASNSKSGYRTRIGLGEPSAEDCESGNNRPLRNGYFFQFRVEITGACTWKGMRAAANSVAESVFARVECDLADCQVIACDLPDNFRLYSLQGLPPVSELPKPTPKLSFSNSEVVYPFPCSGGSLFIFIGIYPTWISYDSANSQLLGAANTFNGATQEDADAQAQDALNLFVSSAVTANKMYCTGTAPATCAVGNNNQYYIKDYYDGLLVNPDGAHYTRTTFLGTWILKQTANACLWGVTDANDFILVSGGAVTCVNISYSGSQWEFAIWTWLGGGSVMLCKYVKTIGSDPAGIYSKSFERNAGNPATLTILPNGLSTTDGTIHTC